jgi:RNA 3'-terminal phosphate cyclase
MSATGRSNGARTIEVDGSRHAGSGSIVRQAYAAVTGQAVQVRNARANRPKPGLRPQHVRAVQAMRELVSGSVDGVTVGSRTFTFRPGALVPEGS